MTVTSADDRINIRLRTLIDLATPATALNLDPGRVRAVGDGNYLSPFKGRGMAFAESRPYQPGDDVRRMDWRVTARTGKPYSKVFREERERPLFISVDYGPTMVFATRGVFKTVQAARLAGLLAWSAHQQGDRIGGQLFSERGCQELPPRNGRSGLLRFFNALVQPDYAVANAAGLQQALQRLQHHAHPGSRVYIISDFRGLSAAAELSLSLLARHCDIMLIQVYDPIEARLPDQGHYRVTDRLRDLVIDAGDSARWRQYRQQFQQRQQRIAELSRKLGMHWRACSTLDAPLSVLLSRRQRPAGGV
ncbi:MAG: DUF58 domain-containing protein [Methylomonas sp.]|nr:DUF58 domain-containing protein [Methylomonas sp.]PPD21931.1 MAG: DUF58 domain-containing protein [Methylomonas sp.]PPD26073.1 MAG: DUF58 domain-containing protein [Methylomonas sp.]PPD37791.1 MAG: DUF58 domain-containing protein [Methylomonas sp.]PPD40629.1 MAG: DUF58 domain-containing protein [Methylomonas sp.]